LRTAITQHISDAKICKEQLLIWSQQFREICFMDSNNYAQEFSSYDCIIAVDAFTAIQTDFHNAFEDLKQYQQVTKDWLFGYLSYDLKNDTEDLKSTNFDGLEFADLFFFQPKKIFLLKGENLEVRYLTMCDDEIKSDFLEIQAINLDQKREDERITIHARISKSEYLEKVKQMLEHINRGDCYEANFCMEYFADHVEINPLNTFLKLNTISNPPFAVYFKNKDHYLLCASPERYLKKSGEILISQPIKGTAKRYASSVEDEKSRSQLMADPKERAENIMITDLVRNDLSQTAQKGSVIVTELCQIYSFSQVHQMISTVTSKLDSKFSTIDAIKKSFPMGSMTGAPKISVMKLIEELEETKRGLYSGAVGYFTPDGDFDFNVVIRSILYNHEKKYVSFSVGSAITALSNPEQEYEECLLKSKAMRDVLA
jgi:para-aminobenzoate synthetase component 1